MLQTTKDLVLPTTITGSLPRPAWYTENLKGRAFRMALADARYREQYFDTVSCHIRDQERAGLDIYTDGDARFDLDVGGRSWLFYPLERMGGLEGHGDLTHFHKMLDLKPGHILWEVCGAWQTPNVVGKITRGPIEYAYLWKAAQQMTRKPVKFGTVTAECMAGMMPNYYYKSSHELTYDLANVLNAELKELADAGCPIIQLEEPLIHFAALNPGTSLKEFDFMVDAFNQSVKDVKTEIWCHTCWGNPSQQRIYAESQSYERSLEHLLRLDCDVLTLECASTGGADLRHFKKFKLYKKIAIGVIDHRNLHVESPEQVAALIRKALEYIPKEKLIISTDCGFGREGSSRRIAYYKMVALVQGTNIVRREAGLPEANVLAADPKLAFGNLQQLAKLK